MDSNAEWCTYNLAVNFEIVEVRNLVCFHEWVGLSHSPLCESTAFPPWRRAVFGSRPDHVGFVMDKVPCWRFPASTSNPPANFNPTNCSTIINHPKLYSLDTESVVEPPTRWKEVESESKWNDKQGLDGLSLCHYFTNLKDWNWSPM
jgi:hypothetical protein